MFGSLYEEDLSPSGQRLLHLWSAIVDYNLNILDTILRSKENTETESRKQLRFRRINFNFINLYDTKLRCFRINKVRCVPQGGVGIPI